MASTSPPPTCSLVLAGTPVSTKGATSKRSLAVSFTTDVVASPSASKRLATAVAAPSNDDDHFMSAVTRAAVSSPLLDSRTAITNGTTAANIPNSINPYINNGVVHPNAPIDIDKPAATTSTTRADETHPDGCHRRREDFRTML